VRRPNLILVTLDTMRADRLGRVVAGHPLTPNISALAERGLTFSRAVAAGVPTYFSFPALFLGGSALDRGKRIGLSGGGPTFVERLRAAGYHTGAVVSSNPYLSRYYSYDRGFDVFDDFSAAGSGALGATASRIERVLGSPIADRLRRIKARLNAARSLFGDGNPSFHHASRGAAVTSRGLSFIERAECPFFLWLHYMDLHGYYFSEPSDRAKVFDVHDPLARLALRLDRQSYLGRWTRLILESEARSGPLRIEHGERDRRLLEGFYDASASYTDRCLGPVFDAAGDDTVVVVTSDHGEEFFEHGRIGHAPFSLYEEIVRVPLVAAGPDVPVGTRDHWVSHGSLAPALLNMAGADGGEAALEAEPRGPVLTESLWGVTTPFPREHLREFDVVVSAREGGHKLIRWEGAGREELYDLEADPDETSDLSGDARCREVRNRLSAAIDERLQEVGVRDARYLLERRVRAVRNELEARARG
jgi:arylsulfatase A-like enzyme